ncbi:MAG: SMI1/KNR4 family protein [Spirochaetes bacterium]|nr:SMI1/KNR4 family protein [Spirochaetota bacterium]
MKKSLSSLVKEMGGFNKNQPVAKDAVKKFEDILKTELPQDYKEFLLEYGYALPEEYVVFSPMKKSSEYIHDESTGVPNYSFEGSGLSHFYGTDLTHLIERYKDRMPENFLPVADDGLGNQICMSLNEKTFGYVYWWDHENEWDEEDYFDEVGEKMPSEAKYQNLYLIANSFYDFFEKLKKEVI